VTVSLIVLAIFVLIQVADVITTLRGLKLGADEASPIGGPLFKKIGFWPTTLILKGAFIALATALTFYVRKGWMAVACLVLVGAYVLWNNLKVIREQKKNP
jgi:hypothetical protein